MMMALMSEHQYEVELCANNKDCNYKFIYMAVSCTWVGSFKKKTLSYKWLTATY